MVSVVNGYVCFSSCDAAAAKQGKDPAAPPGSISGASDKKTSSLDSRAATVLDGALKDLASTPGPLAASLFSPVVVQQKVDLLI
jgi:hypothetical protein